MVLFRDTVDSSVGKLTLLSTEKGLCHIEFAGSGERGISKFVNRHFPGASIRAGGVHNRQAARQIRAYLNGRLKKFTVKLDLKANGFNREVLRKVKAIPYGKVRTYGQIAASLGKPGAARAVGNANRTNPIPIIIPCHRVVAANGLGGYGGGISLKARLLRLEGGDRE